MPSAWIRHQLQLNKRRIDSIKTILGMNDRG